MTIASIGDQTAFTIAAYMRVTSIAISAYDYLETQPTAWRFYKEHWQSRRLTISVLLFSLLRFTSILVLTISNVGFFYSHFTPKTCAKFYLLPPAFKVVQAMVTQAVLGVRTFNLSRRSRRVGWFVLVLYGVACSLQWVTTLYQRTPRVGDVEANCRAVNQAKQLGAYIFYAIAICYDVITTSMSVWYLLKYQLTSSNSVMMRLSRMMIYDGLGYLVALTGVNILNLILYRTSQDIQTAGASLGYCVSWIMSQRLLVHLYDASRERREEDFETALTVSKNVTSARDISRIVRTMDTKNNTRFDISHRVATTMRSSSGTDEGVDPLDEVEVEVRVERTIRQNHYQRPYELEDYSQRSQAHHR